MSPFHAWCRTAGPETRFWTLLVENPRAFSFWSSRVCFDGLELVGVLGVEVEAVDQVRLADRLLEVVEDEHPPRPVGVQ